MKHLKKILYSLFAIILTFSIVACSPDNNDGDTPPNEVNITLSDAKSMVVSSLESENNNTTLKKSLKASTSVGNRNIFVKLGNSEITFVNEASTESNFNGLVSRTKEKWEKFDLNSSYCSEYYDNNYVYAKNSDNSKEKTTFDSSYFGANILPAVDCIYVDLLFIEDAWITIYENTATKTVKDYGFALAMNINMPQYVDFVMDKAEELGVDAEGLFSSGEEREQNKEKGSVNLVIKFDKYLNIIGLDMTIILTNFTNGEYVGLYTSTINILKYSEDITPPSWFNVNDYE